MSPSDIPPPPGYRHPAFEHMTWLDDWLKEPYRPYIGIVMNRSPAYVEDVECTDVLMKKSTAMGLAPYVGRPFVYVWTVGTDQFGREVAGDARIQYMGRDWWNDDEDSESARTDSPGTAEKD